MLSINWLGRVVCWLRGWLPIGCRLSIGAGLSIGGRLCVRGRLGRIGLGLGLGCVLHDDGGSPIVVAVGSVDLCLLEEHLVLPLLVAPADENDKDDGHNDASHNSSRDGSGVVAVVVVAAV